MTKNNELMVAVMIAGFVLWLAWEVTCIDTDGWQKCVSKQCVTTQKHSLPDKCSASIC